MDNMVFTEGTHPNQVLEGLNRLRLNTSLCDVIFCCGGKEFPCHRNVLASCTPYFEAMFTAGMVESTQRRVHINEVQPAELGSLVEYAYTSTVEISSANVQALLAAADLFNVPAVREACCGFLEHHYMDEQNCVGIHLLAQSLCCQTLERHSMDFILDHFSDVCQQEEFLSLSVDKLTEILASDDLNAPNEEMVFEAVMLWLNHCPTRTQSWEKVFQLIRLPLLGASYLHDVVQSVDVVKESQGCQRLISEAMNPACPPAQPRSSTVILLVGGQVGGHRQYNTTEAIGIVESFDPLTKQRKILTPLPKPLSSHGLVVLGTKVYLAGGDLCDGSVSREMWRYDPHHDSWLQMASMNEARSDLGLVAVGGHVFALGGFEDTLVVDSVERYDPIADAWQTVETVGASEHPSGSSVVALDGLIYVMGLEQFRDASSSSSSSAGVGRMSCWSKVHKFNPQTSVWTEVAPMLGSCHNSTACALKGKIYVIGGQHIINYTTLDKVECYNPQTNQWTTCSPMKKPRWKPGVAVVDGMIYVLGGQEDRFQCTIERYCEQTDSWDIVEHMGTGRSDFSCVALRMRKDLHTKTADD